MKQYSFKENTLPPLIINRIWEMPNKYTFLLNSVNQILKKYNTTKGFIDPFAGKYSPAEITNDIEQQGNTFNMDALEFLQSIPDNSKQGVLFDPPYSTEQCLRKYTPKQAGTAGRQEYWSKCKDEISRILTKNGIAISFAWDSTGMGINRGFHLIEVLLICHGPCHNDTIVTVEIKIKQY